MKSDNYCDFSQRGHWTAYEWESTHAPGGTWSAIGTPPQGASWMAAVAHAADKAAESYFVVVVREVRREGGVSLRRPVALVTRTSIHDLRNLSDKEVARVCENWGAPSTEGFEYHLSALRS